MKRKTYTLQKWLSFVTIWIFARMKLNYSSSFKGKSFVTIWIFARMKLGEGILFAGYGFVTIWIFAKISGMWYKPIDFVLLSYVLS